MNSNWIWEHEKDRYERAKKTLEKNNNIEGNPLVNGNLEDVEKQEGSIKEEKTESETKMHQIVGDLAERLNDGNEKLSESESQLKDPWDLDLAFRYYINHIKYRDSASFRCALPFQTSVSGRMFFGPLREVAEKCEKDIERMDYAFQLGRTGRAFKITIIGLKGLYVIDFYVIIENYTLKVENVFFDFSPTLDDTRLNRCIICPEFGINKDISENTTWIDGEIIKHTFYLIEVSKARASIMSRNMSHNIGSHVLSHLHNNLEDAISSNSESFRLGVSHFINYLQERQDYIATIANNDMSFMSSANFKDEIYDFINPDYVHLRHNTAKKCENILLHYIALSEGFQRPFSYCETQNTGRPTRDIKIQFQSFDGTDINSENGLNSLNYMRQLDLALPTLGRQAFFSILENVIRNAAKHDGRNINNDLVILINCYDRFSKDYPKDKGFDGNLGLQDLIEKYYVAKDIEDNYYYITITINNNCEDSKKQRTLTSLRKAIRTPFVNKDGTLNEENKGIKEIRICASWLRSGVDSDSEIFPLDEDMVDEKILADSQWNHGLLREPPLLFVRFTQEGMLQYIICLRKTKQLAYVTNKSIFYGNYDNHEWKAFSPAEYVKMKNNTYRYTVVADGVDYNEIRRHSGCYCFKESEVGSPQNAFVELKERKAFVINLLRFASNYSKNDTIVVNDPVKNPIIADDAREYILKRGAKRFSYKHHYDPKDYQAGVVVEAISGHNSTDRLVRHPVGDSLDLTWFYQHLRALKTKVIIIDERLYKRISQMAEKTLSFLDKRLHICNIEIEDDKVQLHYFKLAQENDRELKEVIVDLKWSGKELLIERLNEEDNNYFKGKLISIHQGIIDKLYDVWGLSDDIGRRRLISEVYKLFAMKPEIIKSNSKTDFLCGLIVHSGRAKPPRNQMPMDLPFVPYSSIEKATMDCKFTLVELLSSAHNI